MVEWLVVPVGDQTVGPSDHSTGALLFDGSVTVMLYCFIMTQHSESQYYTATMTVKSVTFPFFSIPLNHDRTDQKSKPRQHVLHLGVIRSQG